jgi:hypothetical protein
VGASPARFLTPVVVWCGVLDRRSSSCGAYAGVVSISDRAVCYTMLHPHSHRRRGSSISTTGWGSTLLSILRERRRLGIFWLSRTCTNRGLNFEREKRERQSCGFEPHKERKEAEQGCGNQGRAKLAKWMRFLCGHVRPVPPIACPVNLLCGRARR